MAQAVHAGFLFALEHPEATDQWMHDSQFLVVVAVRDEHALLDLAESAEGIRHTVWHEPDLRHYREDKSAPATAVALEPSREARRLCSSMPLAPHRFHLTSSIPPVTLSRAVVTL